MNAVPHQRGLDLLVAHCASLDPDAPSARDRLDDVLGHELAQKLVFALSSGTRSGNGSRSDLASSFVFAA
jgi:hypothetical protein